VLTVDGRRQHERSGGSGRSCGSLVRYSGDGG
jgi:hypothetical protein